MEHILDVERQSSQLHTIFLNIHNSNTILFLGAGASVGEKTYLSKELITYYEERINKKLNEPNITKWIDILSADESFRRTDFDNFTTELLRNLPVTEGHKILASLPWREIITTNYDLLVERAYDDISQTSEKLYELKTIKKYNQLNYQQSNSEVKYIKLNGCIQDKSLYPLVFSSDDFTKQNKFYKQVLNELKNLSPDVSLLSMGYSFSDDFAKMLIEKFDSYNFRDKRWIINVDPYPNENALPYYSQNKICVIKCSFQDFFIKYKEWQNGLADAMVRRKRLNITDSSNRTISIPSKLLLDIDGVVNQLSILTTDKTHIKDEEFYKGEEPTFPIITRNLDVIKTKYIEKFIHNIEEVSVNNTSVLLPVFFITGDFGIGKSTFTLRLIYELEKRNDLELVAFEIIDFIKTKSDFLIQLIKKCKSKNFIIFCDEVEIESNFKSLIKLNLALSMEQIQDCNVYFLVPIRENILEKYKSNHNLSNSHELKIDGKYEKEEIEDLLDKLKKTNLLNFRDAGEKKMLTNKIIREYNSDSFISLMSIITSGKHENILMDCYNQLSKEAKEAFLYTALIHRYNLKMPSSWLRENISMDWNEFINKIVKVEGKGILIQENIESYGIEPDLYFKTKHPLIAENLIKQFIPNPDKQMSYYEQMLKKIQPSVKTSYLVQDLLKAIKRSMNFSSNQIDKLFETAYTKLSDNPYYLLSYAINLQEKKTKSSLIKAHNCLVYAESLIEYRNHKFVHRRGVLNFELAKLYYNEEAELNQTLSYLNDAKELFDIKLVLDPFSSFSFYDYISLLIWELKNIKNDDDDELQKQIIVEDLFELASRTVLENFDRIANLQSVYAEYRNNKRINGKDFKDYLEDLYSDSKLRPYACILLYNFYQKENNIEKCYALISEMENYQDNLEVVKFLFKNYGQNLHIPNIRVKFFNIVNENQNLKKEQHLRYNYFYFIAESYNNNYAAGRSYLTNIQSKYRYINPEFQFEWKDSNNETLIFDAIITRTYNGKFKVKISSLQYTANLIKGDYEKYSLGGEVKVKLHFYLYGLMAEIINTN